ncbi:hypothetical protein TRVA0_014S01288 [Trichomonascus vanleenenianus]|uniref:Jlp2p n=1 Tax=Trichomonascus vanleenenianus TaxID=2268995 RepID=UPI003ECAD1EB
MVYYFKSTGASGEIKPPVSIYMGKNKDENESLIKYGIDRDVWFHVDNLSSAHVYLRLPEGWTWDNIPEEILNDCAQLTKANSITGNKTDDITVIYTPWSNLHKDNSMAAGQVGFHKDKLVKKVYVQTRINMVVNRLNKTKQELFPNLQKEQADYLKEQQRTEAERRRLKEKEELEWSRERKRLAHQRDHAYDDLFTEENLRHSDNQNRDEDYEDDFM